MAITATAGLMSTHLHLVPFRFSPDGECDEDDLSAVKAFAVVSRVTGRPQKPLV